MTPEQINTDYAVENGMITALGKFQGECAYVPYYWDLALQGMFAEDVAGVFFVPFDADDYKIWPELRGSYGIGMEETEQGFVYGVVYDTQADYNAAVEKCEAIEAKESEELSAD